MLLQFIGKTNRLNIRKSLRRHHYSNYKTPRRAKAGGAEELVKVKILPDIDKYFQIGSSMIMIK